MRLFFQIQQTNYSNKLIQIKSKLILQNLNEVTEMMDWDKSIKSIWLVEYHIEYVIERNKRDWLDNKIRVKNNWLVVMKYFIRNSKIEQKRWKRR